MSRRGNNGDLHMLRRGIDFDVSQEFAMREGDAMSYAELSQYSILLGISILFLGMPNSAHVWLPKSALPV